VPEPKPEKQDEGEDKGRSPTGHGRDGKAVQSASSAPATARTQAIDRAANAPGPAPNDEARKTRSREQGTLERTAASTPRAQPTTTSAEGSSRPRAQRRARRDASDGLREPEKPITVAADSMSETAARENDEACVMRQDR